MQNQTILQASQAWIALLNAPLKAKDSYFLLTYYRKEVKPIVETLQESLRGLYKNHKGLDAIDPKVKLEETELLNGETEITKLTKSFDDVLELMPEQVNISAAHLELIELFCE
jgi:uncharacterized LabA/DUF88 family protein